MVDRLLGRKRFQRQKPEQRFRKLLTESLESRELLAGLPEALTISGLSSSPTLSNYVLKSGFDYEIQASGQLQIGHDVRNSTTGRYTEPRYADAQYYQKLDVATHNVSGWASNFALKVTQVTGYSSWSQDSLPATDHTYKQTIHGSGQKLSAYFSDTNYADNKFGYMKLTILSETPRLTVTAGPKTTEGSATTGKFTISRVSTTSINDAIPVAFRFSGQSSDGVADFSFNAAKIGSGPIYKVTIPAGQGSSVVEIKALEDFNHETNEGVKLSLEGASATAFVGFLDSNHAPVFGETSNSYTVYVSPYAAAGSALNKCVGNKATVSATDPDVGDTITYTIKPGSYASKFTINSSTGAVSLASGVKGDDLLVDTNHKIIVVAKDNLGKTAEATVNIYKAVRVGIGGVHIVKEGAGQFLTLNFVRFDRLSFDKVVNVKVSRLMEYPNFNFKSEFTDDQSAKDIFDTKKITIPKGTGIPETIFTKTIKLEAKQDGIVEGIEKFIIEIDTDPFERYVPIKERDVRGKYWGSSTLECSITDNTTLYVKGTNDDSLASGNPGIHYNDLDQTNDDHCQFMATIAGIARYDFNKIKSAITAKTDGSYDVKIRGTTHNIKSSEIFVDAYFTGELSGDVNAQGEAEIWQLVIERAFERETNCDAPDDIYTALGGPGLVKVSSIADTIPDPTGAVDENGVIRNVTLATILLGQTPILFGTPETPSKTVKVYDENGVPNTIIGDHMYLGIGVVWRDYDGLGIAAYAHLYNPHGVGRERYVKLETATLRALFDEFHVFK